jgi:hypothetical protein
MTTEPYEDKVGDAASTSRLPSTMNVRMLKIAVGSMAVLIVAGLGAVMWKIVDLAHEGSTAVDDAKPSAVDMKSAPSTGAALSPEALLALPKGATVRSISLSGTRLAVHYETVGGAEIAILDLETGKALTRIKLPVGP